MTYVLVEQHYVLEPTRTASRWRADHVEEILRTESLDEAAEVTESKKVEPNQDIFCRVLEDNCPGGYRGLSSKELDEFFELRRKYRKERNG